MRICLSFHSTMKQRPAALAVALAVALAAGLVTILIGLIGFITQANASPAAANISLAAGSSHTCALVDGGVRCWGYLASVGVPRITDRPVPVAVANLPAGIVQISASAQHTCALTPTSGVKCWGFNNAGQLGDGTSENRLTPVDVSGLGGPVTALGLGFEHTCAILSDGGVQCWGLNANYQLGATGMNTSYTPLTVPGLTGVRKITGGGAHTCAILTSGALQCWGYNFWGSLGNGQSGNQADTPVPQDVIGLDHGVIDVAAGYWSTCALLDSGAVQCWGQFGDLYSSVPVTMDGLESGVTAITMGSAHLCTLHAGGQVRCLGESTGGGTPQVVPGLESGIVSFSAGRAHTCALTNSGEVRCWGADELGQLGAGTTTFTGQAWPVVALSNQAVRGVSSGANYTCAYTAAGALYCWGLNNYGLGIPGAVDMLSYSLPMPVAGLSAGVTQVSAGTHTCAIVNGGAQCWGRNDVGQLGNGTRENSQTAVAVSGLGSGVSKLSVTPGADQAHTCAIANGAAFCWGGNYVGQLGNGQSGVTNGEATPQAVTGLGSGASDIAAGGYHSCAVVNGAALCWGSAYYGQLGNGDSGPYAPRYPNPVAVSGLGSSVTAVTAGREFACAVVGGAARCWGRNHAGQLGDGSTVDRDTPGQVSGLTSGVTAISAGDDRACALKNTEVWCWGGTAGQGSTPYKIAGVSSVTAISASYSSCAIDPNGLACWGDNHTGQLGDGRLFKSDAPVKVLGFGPQPELRVNYAEAAAGSPLRLVGANFPPNVPVLLQANGLNFCTVNTNQDGFFPAVILTGGAANGYYQISARARGVETAAGFTLMAGSPLRNMEGGGPTCTLAAAAEPTPFPTPTTAPGSSLPAPRVDSVFPAQGDASLAGRVEIFGQNFRPGAIARLGNIPAPTTSFVDSTHLTALLPGGLTPGVYDLVVVNPDWSKGSLAGGYTAMNVDPASPVVQDDLYGNHYELTPDFLYETEGQATKVWFTVRRLGGKNSLNDIRLRFYVGAPGLADPANQASLIGESTVNGLAPNGRQTVGINWTPAQAGQQELYVTIDALNTVVELDETNNVYHNWVEVRPAEPLDTTPPVVTSVSAPLTTISSYIELAVDATDAGGSGVAWVNFVVWEYFPASRAWLMTDESGWRFFKDGQTNHPWYGLGYFSGPRIIDVWVADKQENVSLEPYSVVVNYIEPDSFIFPGESHLFLFPLLTGDIFQAYLTNAFPEDDADLYLWPPDYPSHNYWGSANEAGFPEALAVTIPVDGMYWLEVYGYDYSFYTLTAGYNLSEAANLRTPEAIAARPPRVGPPVDAGNLPGTVYRLTQIWNNLYLPLVTH